MSTTATDDALWRGVSPFYVNNDYNMIQQQLLRKVTFALAADGLTLAFNSMSTTASCPLDDALWRGVSPSYVNNDYNMIQ